MKIPSALPVDHLGVAGDDPHAGPLGGRRHPSDDAREFGDRQPLFQDEGGGEGKRPGPAHRQIVDRAVDRQLADRAPGEDERLDDVGVGREGEPAAVGEQAGDVEDGRVAELLKDGIAEGGQKNVLEEILRQRPAPAVAHHDLRPVPQRCRAGKAGDVGRRRLCHQVRPAL